MPASAAISSELTRFLTALEAVTHSHRITNPYRLSGRSDNLHAYLSAVLAQPGRRMLLVGEALGYRGGLLTGIPFSSGALLSQPRHPFLRRLAPQLQLEDQTAEATASITWQALAQRRVVPLFWNAFPFHPHLADKPRSNRAPLREEVTLGIGFLQALADMQQPQLIAGVGSRGTEAAQRAFPDRPVVALRHPSYGGKVEFVQGLHRLYRRRLPGTLCAPM